MPPSNRRAPDGPFRVSPRAAMHARDVSRDDVPDPDLPAVERLDVEAERRRIRRALDERGSGLD